jgi:NADP-dependent 3-hydroxy acid dehydrogenase YdfG
VSPPLGLITGGLSGIGAATAVEFGRLGARLVLLDIGGDGEQVGELVRAAGGHATTITCDVSRPHDVEAAVNSAVAKLAGLDFVVANAGIAEQSLIASGDPERWARVVSTNLLGSMNTVRAALPLMRTQRRGHILIVASVSGREAYVGEPSYIASKFGLIGFAHALRMEAAEYGVRVTVVEPGSVATPLTMDNPVIRPLMDTIEPLAAQDVARCLVFAYQQPPHAVISELVIRPLNEPTNELPGFGDFRSSSSSGLKQPSNDPRH